jgi:hypothetical protein
MESCELFARAGLDPGASQSISASQIAGITGVSLIISGSFLIITFLILFLIDITIVHRYEILCDISTRVATLLIIFIFIHFNWNNNMLIVKETPNSIDVQRLKSK